jgi:hypothetical protein
MSEALKNFDSFRNTFRPTKLLCFYGLSPDRLIFSEDSLSAMKLYLDIIRTMGTIITNIKAAMAKRYICDVCKTL